MSIREIKTTDGVKLQDSVTKKFVGSVGKAKTAIPTPSLNVIARESSKINIEDNLNCRFQQYSKKTKRESGEVLEDHIPPEEWDVIEISQDLLRERNKGLALAELEELRVEKEEKINSKENKLKKHISQVEEGRKRSHKKKENNIKKRAEYKLPHEKYGPQWLELAKLLELASYLSTTDVARVNETFNKLAGGSPDEPFSLESSLITTPATRKHENQQKLKWVRKQAYISLKATGRELAIDDLLNKAPAFQDKKVALDTILALTLRDKLSLSDYNLLTWSWRACFFKIHLDDTFMEGVN